MSISYFSCKTAAQRTILLLFVIAAMLYIAVESLPLEIQAECEKMDGWISPEVEHTLQKVFEKSGIDWNAAKELCEKHCSRMAATRYQGTINMQEDNEKELWVGRKDDDTCATINSQSRRLKFINCNTTLDAVVCERDAPTRI
ncbi:hypothetical protein Q1695_015827 [Nippostrongylus brasiliensis]|nr:hypothetical protein Q1695_015827 [Nippostrongylus brasiliensis]